MIKKIISWLFGKKDEQPVVEPQRVPVINVIRHEIQMRALENCKNYVAPIQPEPVVQKKQERKVTREEVLTFIQSTNEYARLSSVIRTKKTA